MKIMLMKIKDGMIVASHIMATGIDLEIYSDIMGIIDTFGHAHYSAEWRYFKMSNPLFGKGLSIF